MIKNRNLKCIINRLQNTRRKGSGTTLVCFMFMVILGIFASYMYRRQLLYYNFDVLENSVTEALLAGAVINLDEYALSGNLVISEGGAADSADAYFIGAKQRFEDTLKCNLEIDDNWNIDMKSGVKGKVNVLEFTVYNYQITPEGYRISSVSVGSNGIYSHQYPVNTSVIVKADDKAVEVKETSVFAEVEFDVRLSGYFSWADISDDELSRKYTLRRIVSVTDRR